jgi:plastocyanin
MHAPRRVAFAGVALALTLGSALPNAWPGLAAGPTTTTYKIGVDNAAPGGHNWLFVDFFPRAGLKVHRHDVLDFSWNTRSLDGFHNVSVQPGDSGNPLVTVDGDDPAPPPQLELNPLILFPTNPACGTKASPCDYSGSRVASGANPTAPGFDFFVEVDVAPGSTLNFLCEVHPGMSGSLKVVGDKERATTLDELRDAAARQHREDTEGALRAEEATEHDAVRTRDDGTRSLTVTAGTASQFVEVSEMLPRNIEIRPGDTVKWVTKTIKDIHTVTFPQGHLSDPVDPLPFVCEGSPDTAANPPPNFCTNPLAFENHVNPQPMGTTVITSPTTVGSSGVLANPGPNSFSFSFPNAGTFVYQCRVHDHMIGTVEAEKGER